MECNNERVVARVPVRTRISISRLPYARSRSPRPSRRSLVRAGGGFVTGAVTVEAVAALSCLGDYAAVVDGLAAARPQAVLTTTPHGPCGFVDDDMLASPDGATPGDTRAERMILALLAQLRPAIGERLSSVDPTRVAVIVGTSAGGIAEAESNRKPGHRFGPGYDFRFQRLGHLARYTADAIGARGLVTGTSTACTSGARAIGLATRWLDLGWCDLAVAGGVDARCEMTARGFAALEVVSEDYCRPFDVLRDGINLGEGGALLILSRDDRRRGGVRVVGYADAMDAWHASTPHPEGRGIAAAMTAALAMAGCRADEVGYVNMHGTATVLNDAMEARAVREVIGPDVPVSSTKALTGHTLAGAGALEAAICHALLAGDVDALPVQHGHDTLDPAIGPLAVVTADGRRLERPFVVSNSCGFGGHNAALVMVGRDD